jgi:hypothetical protein
VLEDYAVVFFGSSCFKIIRLFVIAGFSVHLFGCIFYRVKMESNDDGAITAFYIKQNTDPEVCFELVLPRVQI